MMKSRLPVVIAACLFAASSAQAVTQFDVFFDFDSPQPGGFFTVGDITLQGFNYDAGGVTYFTPVGASFSPFRLASRFAFDSTAPGQWFGRTRNSQSMSGSIAVGHNIVTPDAPLQYFVFYTNNVLQMDNLTISVIANVPEPRNWAMLLAGFGAVGWQLRARRHAAATS
nr:PEPxxWA-CTERM sorting domain-containing protein [Sandarakinorhabdus sp.]